MNKLIAASVLALALPCAGWAKGAAAPIYIVTVTPAGQPGNSCIADGVATGQETKTADGSTVLVRGVHGANSARCPDTAFPNLATTQKMASEASRSVPSTQCVPQGAKVGDEVSLPFFGLARVLQLHTVNSQCNAPGTGGTQEATVIGAAAYRAQNPGNGPGGEAKAAETSSAPREPTEAEIRAEFARLHAAAPPVEEYRVRHVLVATRQEADEALAKIKAGTPFAEVAAAVSRDPGSRINGGNLGWATRTSYVDEFSRTMVSLKPFGLAQTPTKSPFGWHVIELLEVKMGKESFPDYASVRDRVALKLKRDGQQPVARTPVNAVCRKPVAPEMPAAAVRDRLSGQVVAEMLIVEGKVTEIIKVSGPDVFHDAVIAALRRYECDRIDTPVIATQKFEFKLAD